MGQKTHCQFLKTLKSLLPVDCVPLVLTDAGFQNSWFKLVIKVGWDFIGRVKNRTHYCEENGHVWAPIKSLYDEATLKARYIGRVFLSMSSPILCYLYVMKQRKKHRVKKNLAAKKVQCSSSLKHARREKEPWLIASTLSSEEISAIEVMLLYKKRMQIEETFRDLKNTRNGFGLRQC